MRRLPLALCGVALLAGCSSSSRPAAPTIAPARTYALSGFSPVGVGRPGNVRLAFTIRQPSGAALTRYRTGAGPHTRVHVIVVRRDLAVIVHRHPQIGPEGRIAVLLDLPQSGPYRVLVDAYPRGGRNFQLHRDIRVGGGYRPRRLPRFAPAESVEGYRVTLAGPRRLRAIEPAFFVATVRDREGRPAPFTPWFGALAHAIFFRAGSLDYFHTHVCGPSTPGCTSVLGGARVVGRATKPGAARVGVLLPVAGTWRLFLQFETRGRVVTAPFTLRVR
jgi:hypothetical protein